MWRVADGGRISEGATHVLLMEAPLTGPRISESVIIKQPILHHFLNVFYMMILTTAS